MGVPGIPARFTSLGKRSKETQPRRHRNVIVQNADTAIEPVQTLAMIQAVRYAIANARYLTAALRSLCVNWRIASRNERFGSAMWIPDKQFVTIAAIRCRMDEQSC